MTIRNPYAKKRPRPDSCSANTTTSTSSVAPPPPPPPPRIANVTNVIQQQPPRTTAFKHHPVPSTATATATVDGGINRHVGSIPTHIIQPVRHNSTHYSSSQQPPAKNNNNNNSNSLGNVYRPSNNVVPSNSKFPQNQPIGFVYQPSTNLTGAVYKERETHYDRSSHVKTKPYTAVAVAVTSYGNSNNHPTPNETLPKCHPPSQQVSKPITTTLMQNTDVRSQTRPSNMASSLLSLTSLLSSNSRAVSTTRNPYPQSAAAATCTDTSRSTDTSSKASSITAPLQNSVGNRNPYPTTLTKVPMVGSNTTSRNPYANTNINSNTTSTTTISGPSGAATLTAPAATLTRPPSPMNPYAKSKSVPASGATSDSNRNPYAKISSTRPCTTSTHGSTLLPLLLPGTSRPPSPMNPYLKLKSLPGVVVNQTQTLPSTGSGSTSVPSSPANPYRKSVPTSQSQSTTTGAVDNPISMNYYRSSSRNAQPIKPITAHSSLGARPPSSPLPTTTNHSLISQQSIVGHASVTIQQPQPKSNQNALGAAVSRSVITASSNSSFMQTGSISSNPVVAPIETKAPTQLPVNVNRIPGRTNAAAAHSLASLRPTSWANNAPQSNATQDGVTPLASIPGIELPGEPTLPKEIQFSPDSVKPVEDEYRQQLVKHANLSAPLLNGWKLFSHQKRAILKGLLMRRVVMALDMGLGKTLIGCVWSKAFKKTYDCLKIFVICPVSLKTEWQRTAENTTGLQVENDSTVKSAKANKHSLDMKICSWAKVVTDVERSVGHYVVVCDEAHSMQSMQASRTKDVLKLVKGERCVGVLLLTGTPMKNGKPCNLFPLLKAVRHPFGNNQKEFERHFCAGAEKNFGRGRPVWDASGSSNLKQLKRLVASHLLHLTKAQCLAELPPLTRETRKVPVSSRCQLQYIEALKSLANVHAQAAAREDDNESVLGAVQRLRVTCSHAKVGATVELAIKVLEQEPALVLFTSFAQVAKQVHQQLAASGWEGELLTGETPAKKRQGMVDNFQEGLSPVFVCTYGAGGVGLTLTAASTIILLDRPWTPGDTRQAEDRVRRIGQTKAVKAIWMSAFDMDTQVDDMLESKTQTSNAILADGHSPTGNGAKISIPKLLGCLMAKVS